MSVDIDDILSRGFWIVLSLIMLAAVAFGGYAITMSARSNGEIDYCFVVMWSPQEMAPQWQLYGHRPWRSDRVLGTFVSIDEAKAKADLVACPLTTRKP